MADPLWSYLLAAVGIVGLYLAGRRRAVGWIIGFAAQFLWIAYALVSGQHGFIVSALAYGAVYLRNWWAWRSPRPVEVIAVADASGFAAGDAIVIEDNRVRSVARIPRG